MGPDSIVVSSGLVTSGLSTAKQQRIATLLLAELQARSGNLPGERELASRMGVSRRTIRTVLQWLEQQGHVQTIPFHGRQARSKAALKSTLGDTICLLGDVPAEDIPVVVRADGRFETVQFAAASALRESRFHTLILQLQRMTSERYTRLIQDRPAGMVLFQHFASFPETRAVAEAVRAARIPFVLHSDDPEIEGFDFVCSDHHDGAYRLTRNLIERGCRHILRCWLLPAGTPLNAPWLIARTRGSEQAIREAGLELLPLIEARCELREKYKSPRESFEHGVRVAAGYLLDYLQRGKTIDAVMAPSDYECLCMAAACRKFGLVPGRDILVSGYDNCWAELPERQWEPSAPAITADKRNAVIGAQMIEILLARINSSLPQDSQKRIVTPELIVPAASRAG